MKKNFKTVSLAALLITAIFSLYSSCSKSTAPPTPPPPPPPPPTSSEVSYYLTKGDRTALFAKQPIALNFKTENNSFPTIEVDTTQQYQTMDGFGFALTGGSATLINSLPEDRKTALLNELFLHDSTFIGISYLRISIGASDLSAAPFTYDEVAAGQTDPTLANFSIDIEKRDLIPVLKRIIALNPDIKIMGSPWTAPTWMKDNKGYVGGKLLPEYYDAYAKYFVKYIQAMKSEGIVIDAITIQNEPLHDGNNPSMKMLETEQRDFIKNNLGPAFRENNIHTKIIVYDHNADRPDYPITILNDPEAKQYIDGSAFHLYGGSISALTQVHNAHPDKHLYFTEQWTGGPGNFAGDLSWHLENLVIGAPRNWSRNVIEWNLAADQNYDPHTPGGCSTCMGALTINGATVTRNVSYYIIASASKFVRPGSVRIASNNQGSLLSVAFKNPQGKKVLIVLNKAAEQAKFNIKFNGKLVSPILEGGSVGTFVWN